MLVSQGSSNKALKSGWLKTTEMYCLIGLEAGSPKSQCCRAMLSLTTLVENPSLSLPASGVGQKSLASLDLKKQPSSYTANFFLGVFTPSPLCVCLALGPNFPLFVGSSDISD